MTHDVLELGVFVDQPAGDHRQFSRQSRIGTGMNSLKEGVWTCISLLLALGAWESLCSQPAGFFTNVEELGAPLNSPSREHSPNISADELSLYFHSDRPDGRGGDDLYVATRNGLDEPFDNPTNDLGEGINTRAGEGGASISYDGLTLFFVSRRDGGEGDNDIYMETRDGAAAIDPKL